jgi:hypothetical protein
MFFLSQVKRDGDKVKLCFYVRKKFKNNGYYIHNDDWK